jgi:aconitate hydratase
LTAIGTDTLKTRRTLTIDGRSYEYFSLAAAEKAGLAGISRLPYSMKVLLENLLRHEDGRSVTVDDLKAVAAWVADRRSDREIGYRPARVLMQDFTGVPAVVDLAAMRDAMAGMGGDVRRINPLSPVDLVIDHSVVIDHAGASDSLAKNVRLEYERNGERYNFLRWGQSAFGNFRVVPPGTGICHQVNLEYLAQTVWVSENDGRSFAYPDTLVGTDSHTTMVNGLAVLGWGVGGIEAEAAMLGQPVSMVIPEVVGFRLTGQMREGLTATDLVLTVTQMLRKKGVVNKFVEFFGPGLDALSLADRATIANMAPEYGATCGFFPVDQETLNYLALTGRDAARIKLVEAYAKAQGMWRDASSPDPVFTEVLELDMGTVEPSLAGPKRPQDRVALGSVKANFEKALPELLGPKASKDPVKVGKGEYALRHGDVVIAAITSCTNTSNPAVLVAAGLLAKKANELGLRSKPWVKTSLAPGSQVVTDYLAKAGLQPHLDALGFNLAGYGCTTCIGNSGPLPDEIAEAIDGGDLTVSAVISGNRNFEGRVHPQVKANYLASPPLVVAYALAGSVLRDVATEPLGMGKDGKPVYLRDVWPSNREIAETMRSTISAEMYRARYADVFKGDADWQRMGGAEAAALLQGHVEGARHLRGHLRGAAAGAARRLDHDRPHLPGRLDQAQRAGGRVPARAPGARAGLQPVRHAPRQPRDHDARHLRQHPAEERDGARHLGRRHAPHALGRADVDLRRGDALPEGGRAAGRRRRQGIRHGLQPRLGGQGHAPARHPRGAGGELRAHPPLQPRRHGRPAAAVQGRHDAPVAQARRQRGLRRDGDRAGREAGHGRPGRHPPRRRQGRPHRRVLPDRYARRGRVLPARRHPALRAARPAQGLVTRAAPGLPPRRGPGGGRR